MALKPYCHQCQTWHTNEEGHRGRCPECGSTNTMTQPARCLDCGFCPANDGGDDDEA